jgi:hypothetical protein
MPNPIEIRARYGRTAISGEPVAQETHRQPGLDGLMLELPEIHVSFV